MDRFPTWDTIGEAVEGAYVYSTLRRVSEVTIVLIMKGPEAGKFTLDGYWLPPDVVARRAIRVNFSPEPDR